MHAWTQLDRYRVEGLELYSTVLWHLRRDADLSFLAQHALATDRLAPNVRACERAWVGELQGLKRVVSNLLGLRTLHALVLV